jgi:epoxyqueuosine reductase
MSEAATNHDYAALARSIKAWGRDLGFQAVGIANTDLGAAERGLAEWLAAGFHGEMDYMARHGSRRARPGELHAGTLRVISARMNYQPQAAEAWSVIRAPDKAYIARYATGRDYHKVLRGRLAQLARRIEHEIGAFGHRIYTDSAPVMEVELAANSGLGWRGKHTLLLSRDAGSYFFLGEIYTDLPLPVDAPVAEHCGSCSRCLDICPTRAIVAPYRLDARRCISYLTIELKGSIPPELRPLIGNRVYGCDDCQLVCPWNRYAEVSGEADFRVRHGLDDAELTQLFAWSECEFHERMAGSAIHRIGFERWSRNLAVGLGNAASSAAVVAALHSRAEDPSPLVREHVAWALQRHSERADSARSVAAAATAALR